MCQNRHIQDCRAPTIDDRPSWLRVRLSSLKRCRRIWGSLSIPFAMAYDPCRFPALFLRKPVPLSFTGCRLTLAESTSAISAIMIAYNPCDLLTRLLAPKGEIETVQVVVITEDLRNGLCRNACRPGFDDFSHIYPFRPYI